MEAMAQMEDNAFDLAIVDPPYGIGDVFIPFSTGVVKGKLERTHKVMSWDKEIPTSKYFKELKRVSKNQIIWGANYFNCFDPGGAVVWYKNNGAQTLSQCEIASLSFKKCVDYIFIQQIRGFVQKIKTIHPTQKPVILYKWLLKNYAKPGYRILDTHLGSGSSRIAAHDMGFDFEGYEIDKDYFDAQEKRFQNHIKQQSLFKPNEMYT